MPANPPGQAVDSARQAEQTEVEVEVPSGPPVLTLAAARELLAVILEAHQQLVAKTTADQEAA